MSEKSVYMVGWLGKLYVASLLFIFGFIVLHAPLSVWLGTLLPDFELVIKSWKEILMGLSLILGLLLIYKNKYWQFFKDKLVILTGAYALIHLLLLAFNPQGFEPTVAGLFIDLRYVLFFALVYLALKLYPGYKQLFLKVGVVGALLVVAFALLQVFILPKDILKHIGYGSDTIVPYLTVDENPDFVRINSTLRGPNPLGAYAVIVLSLVAAFWVKNGARLKRSILYIISFSSIGGLVALWYSYSRSALIAGFVALFIVLGLTIGRKLSKKTWIISTTILFAITATLFAARDTYFVSNVILHENPVGGSEISSNQGHVESLNEGFVRMLEQPLGAGIGSTGSASLLGEDPFIIENQYLFIAHESGWLGLGLFLAIFIMILNKLWQRRGDWLSLGVFASGIGLALIGLLLPVWADDTVSIVWWGLAALAVSYKPKKLGVL